jgi:hypothetical protein
VWLEVPAPAPPPEPPPAPEDDPLAACISQVGYLTGDLKDILQQQADAIRAAKTLKAVRTIVRDGLQPAIDTLARGGQ